MDLVQVKPQLSWRYCVDEQEAEKVIEVIQGGHSKNGKNDTSGIVKAVAIITGVSALVLMVSGQISPLRQRQDAIENRLERIESRTRRDIESTDAKIQIEVESTRQSIKLEMDRAKARLDRVEEWMVWWNRTIQPIDATQNARLDAMESRIAEQRKGP